MGRNKLIIIFTVLINVIGMGIIIPVLPHYVESFGATPFQVTLLFAVFALCSFISSPFLGALSDRVGRRPMLIISIISTAIGWFVFATAHSLTFLFIGRIIDGMAAGNISIAQSSLVDISKDPKDRTHNLGLVGAAFGVGFVIGPLIGGLLSSYSPIVPFWFATVLAFIDVLVALIYLKETNKNPDRSAKLEWNPLMPLIRASTNKVILPGLFAWLFFIMAVSAIQATFALYLDSAFGIGSFGAGMLFAVLGIIVALNQLVGLRHFWLKFFAEPSIEFWMILITGIGFFIMGVRFIAFFVIGLIITAFGQSVLRAVMVSQIVSNSSKNARGEVIGITSSIQAAAMAISPVIAGYAFGFRDNLPFVLSGIYLLVSFSIIYFNRKRLVKLKISEDVTIMGG